MTITTTTSLSHATAVAAVLALCAGVAMARTIGEERGCAGSANPWKAESFNLTVDGYRVEPREGDHASITADCLFAVGDVEVVAPACGGAGEIRLGK